MSENLNIDKQMREKLEGFSMPPPPHVWNNVMEEIAAQQKKKRMIYTGWISAAAVILLVFLAGWYFNNSSEITTPLVVEQQTIQSEKTAKNPTIRIEKSLTAELAKDKEADDNQIKNTRKDLQSNINTLIATTQKTSDKSDIASTIPNYKRVEMKMIESISFQFNIEQPEVLLAENAIPNKKYHLTETDKLLIASNVTSVKSKNRTETGWKVGIGITPAYSSSVVSYSESYSKNMNYSDESSNGNIGGGFSIQYKTSKKLRIESGVYYAQNGQTSTNTVQLFTNRETADYAMAAPKKAVYANTVKVSKGNMAMNSTAGVIVMSATPKGAEINSELDAFNPQSSNSIVSDGEFSQVFDFVEIPLYLRYRVLDSKFGIELVGGVNAGVVVGNNAYIDNSYGLQNIGETEDISTVNLSGTVGVGLNYALGKHISMAVEPRLNYYFNSINENPDVDFRPYRVGIFTGLYYEF